MTGVLMIEPFYGGSHKQLIDLIHKEISSDLFTSPAKKWHWKARTSALWFGQIIPEKHKYKILFTSSVLNLSELVGLRPDLYALKKIIYFHENQLVYPVRKSQNRDFQYGYNQILSCLVADVVLFNSKYNMESFLTSIKSFLKLIPDHRPKNIEEKIRPKCKVLYFPLKFPEEGKASLECDRTATGRKCFQGEMDTQLVNNDHNQSCTNLINTDDTSYNVKRYKMDHSICDDVDIHVAKEHNVTHFTECDSVETKQDNAFSISDNEVVMKHPDENKKNCTDNTIDDSNEFTKHQELNTSNHEQIQASTGAPTTLHILWAHRWEHDKDPETLFKVLYQLHEEGLSFILSLLGESFTDVPEIFDEAKEKLSSHIVNWGYREGKEDYYAILKQADVTISTALHEFFGVAMLESTYYGCYPLCPNRLVYPEIFPACCLYNTPNQLYKKLREFCRNPHLAKKKMPKIDINKFLWQSLKQEFMTQFTIT